MPQAHTQLDADLPAGPREAPETDFRMTWTAPARPKWVADLNAIAVGVGGTEHLVPLDDASLLDAAGESLAGLGECAEGFQRLTHALRDEADLHAVGALITRSELVRALQNRRRVETAHSADPTVGNAPIVAPLIISGLPRSGTSILHELLAQDPQHRVPQTWEVFFSTPAPDAASYTSDPRITLADHDVTFWNEVTPTYRTMHENAGHLPAECIVPMAQVFVSRHWAGSWPVPSYAAWMAQQDMHPALAYHRRLLQVLQSRHMGQRWVLKAPSHLAWLPALFDTYPDAWLVQTHRDPLQSVPSTIDLMATLQWMRSNHTQVETLIETIPPGYAALLNQVMAWRADGRIPAERIIDVRYHDLLRDPLGTLTSVYERIGSGLSATTRARIRDYLAAKPKGKHGAHLYSLASLGLDAANLRRLYASYREAYDVRDESSPP